MIQGGHVPAEDVKRITVFFSNVLFEFIHESQSTATILIRINGEDVHKDDHVNVNDNKQFMKCIISIIDDGRYRTYMYFTEV